MNYVTQPVEPGGDQTNSADDPYLEFGKVIDLHPVFAAMALARKAAEANATDPADVVWDPAWPDLEVDNDDYWNDLVERNWEILSRWYSMSVWAAQKGKRLHFKVVDGVETVTAINAVLPNMASEMVPAITTPVDDTVSTMAKVAPSAIATPQELTELRLKLHSSGYHPVPVIGAHVDTPSAGKKPAMQAWATKCATANQEEVAGWSRSQRDCTNTGILCGEIVGVDIDVLDAALSEKLVARAQELFGPTSLLRIGRAPKTLLVYRVEAPHRKLSTPDLILGDVLEDKNARAKVEILAQGQQFVGFGIHPFTSAAYHWTDKSPLDVPLSDIPVVTLELLQQFISESERILRAAGGRTATEIKKKSKAETMETKEKTKVQEKEIKTRENETRDREQQGNKAANVDNNEKPSREKIADALNHVVNDLEYDEWINIGFALYDGLGDGGRDLWESWSATYPGNDPEVTAAKWNSFATGHSVKIATLFWFAKEQGWWWKDAAPEGHIKLDDFQAFLPEHKYLFTPTCDLWSAISVNSQLQPVLVLDKNGKPKLGPSTKNKAGQLVRGEPVFSPANEWLDKNQSVLQMTWAPGLPMLIRGRLIQDGGWYDHAGASCFNLYRPPTIALGDAMKAGRWVDHVKRVYPENHDHITKWLAYKRQHPEVKINHNIVLGGNVGVGKDTLLAPAVQAVGPWNCSEVSPANLFEPFNEYLKAVLMRVSEAHDIGDVSKFQLYERMKTIGAAPPETLRVNEKNKPAHHVANIVGVIITTNHKTNGLYLPADDRRHYVTWSDVKHSDFESVEGAGDASKYFDALWNWYLQEDGFEHVAAYLATLDISGFNPKAPPDKTPAFWAIVDANRPSEESEIVDLLETIGNPPVVTLEWMAQCSQDDLSAFFKDRKNRATVRHRLENAGYEPVRNDTAKDGFWKVDGSRRVIYARKDLSVPEQFKAARSLAAGCVWQYIPGAFPGDGRAFQAGTWKWGKPASLAMVPLHSSESLLAVA
jgi:hypothetical protein